MATGSVMPRLTGANRRDRQAPGSEPASTGFRSCSRNFLSGVFVCMHR